MEATRSKLPALTLAFWIMKICATTLGETAGDLLSMTLGLGYLTSSLVLFAFFAGTVTAQLLSRRYVPALYWAVILSTSTAGTTMSDLMDRTLGLGYARGAAILVALVGLSLAAWWALDRTLAVDSIRTRRAEALYWTTILFSNTLGTALGDFLADDSGLGFLGGALVVGGLLALIVVLTVFTKLSRVALFWAAFVLTRPFGATVGDVFTKSREQGGLGFGTYGASAVLALVLIALVVRETVRNRPPLAPSEAS